VGLAGRGFTPALGVHWLTPLYDLAIALFTRERRWRRLLARQIDPQPGERILDIGCGTGSLALLVKQICPEADVIGLDPDPAVLARARRKARKSGVPLRLVQGFARAEVLRELRPIAKIASSLVLHQVPVPEKIAILDACFAALRAGGELHLADYGRQRGLSKLAFRLTVQALDGRHNTEPNARGILDELLVRSGFHVESRAQLSTLTGTIRLWRCVRPASSDPPAHRPGRSYASLVGPTPERRSKSNALYPR
jgi:SAM-dependent methyltransferase